MGGMRVCIMGRVYSILHGQREDARSTFVWHGKAFPSRLLRAPLPLLAGRCPRNAPRGSAPWLAPERRLLLRCAASQTSLQHRAPLRSATPAVQADLPRRLRSPTPHCLNPPAWTKGQDVWHTGMGFCAGAGDGPRRASAPVLRQGFPPHPNVSRCAGTPRSEPRWSLPKPLRG